MIKTIAKVEREIIHTSVLVQGLQTVAVAQQGAHSLPHTVSARLSAPLIQQAVGHQVWAPLGLHILDKTERKN